ncbi:Major facilitator superfamily [Dillenia turbinata]|uniref:Major facilitator superfamily n=1 Tax=Dillenia turbinata TaxID=194707 RepID=A0AAN8V559_9MAGN
MLLLLALSSGPPPPSSLPSPPLSLRSLNGIGLTIVTPAIQSLIVDSIDDSNRGTAFSWLQLIGSIGSIIGNLCFVPISSTSFLGVPGWRVAFHLVGLLELIGFSHRTLAFLMTQLVVGYSFNTLFGGKMGDILAR